MLERIKTDVLVVGAGGAGMMAAAEAAKAGARVCVASKSRLMRGGATVMAPGAVAAVCDEWKEPLDSVASHIDDSIKSAQGLGDPFIITQTCELAGDMIKRLESMGAMFQRTDDGRSLALRITGGHSHRRSPFIENRVGREICRALWGELQRLGVEIVEQVLVTTPLIIGAELRGASGVTLRDGRPIVFEAGRVIIATGGAGRVYALTDNPDDVTGDGYDFALKAGARLTDMEFVQFFPISFLYPEYARGQVAGFPAYVRLYNNKNERFMTRYDDRLELATRDALCIAVAKEVRAGRGSEHGGVYCSLEHCETGRVERELPGLYEIYRNSGIDIYTDRFEVGPSCHFFQGGVKVDDDRQTCVRGLYAVGEAAAGMHGANRLGQNALSDILVSGFIAGRHAASASHNAGSRQPEPTIPQSADDIELRRRCAQIALIMQNGAGVLREGAELKNAEAQLDEMARNAPQEAAATRAAAEFASMLATARCVVKSALLRTESRGCHYRDDYPLTDDVNWLRHIEAELTEEGLRVGAAQ